MRQRPGYGTLFPYVFAERCDDYVAFLIAAFGADVLERTVRPDGTVANVRLRFGDTGIMVSPCSDDFPASRIALYLYVADADAGVARAAVAGATIVMAVADMPYGDRQGGVRDPWGNLWWVSQWRGAPDEG